MITKITKLFFGTKNERELKRIRPIVERVNSFEKSIQKLSDGELKAKTAEFKQKIENGISLDELLPEAFAVVRETSVRTLGMRHFDAQVIGGIVLHEGKITEMKTGEGKTLVATLPVYLNALTNNGVHVVTVNDYLAKRDSEWMGTIYKFLGLDVGVIVHGMDEEERQLAYNSNVTYGTNNEFGFDYLRDNMKFSTSDFVQRKLNYAIVDEVDSILIDEARTPLIISGPAEDSTEMYYIIDGIIPFFSKEKHFTIDEKAKAIMLTEEGVAEVERRLHIENLYDPQHINILHHVNQALRAHAMYKKDVDYVVKDNQVLIVDEFTGRLMPGRRWSDGLHQAVEAKEKVKIESENQTLATVTFQNFFRMYNKLSGMTGTADTEAPEFAKIYNLDVLVIPTNMPMIRKDNADVIFKTNEAKYKAVVEEIKHLHERGQPVLVGTISIENSEQLARMLSRSGVTHHVLNAKHHEKEADIVSQAGRKGTVTLSTNMAGRGTDIMLGGNPEFMAKNKVNKKEDPEKYETVLNEYKEICAKEKEEVIAAGGLAVIGTERHESRRIDNQLRGRSGRQGDPGASRFYLSLEDDLLRVFGGDKIMMLMEKMGMEEDEALEHSWLSRAIENAQKKVEGQNFQIRKTLLEYDDVLNLQRNTVYERRREILTGNNKELAYDMIDQSVTEIIEETIPDKIDESYDPKLLEERILLKFNFIFSFESIPLEKRNKEDTGSYLYELIESRYKEREQENGDEIMRQVERLILLQTLDQLWKDHLLQMDHLREGIGLRGYAQKDPLLEYKKEGYLLFHIMLNQFVADSIEKLFRVQVTSEKNLDMPKRKSAIADNVIHEETSAFQQAASASRGKQIEQKIRNAPKVGRNDPCPCEAKKPDGTPIKYKHCCGK